MAAKKSTAKIETVEIVDVEKELIALGFDLATAKTVAKRGVDLKTSIDWAEMLTETVKESAKAQKEEAKKKKEDRETRKTEIQDALVKICGANVPEMYNSVRDEKRFSVAPKKIPEGRETVSNDAGVVTKIHDRDLVGIRFEDNDGFKFCFQVEVPFARKGKLDLSASEHTEKKNELLSRINNIILGSFTPKGEYISFND